MAKKLNEGFVIVFGSPNSKNLKAGKEYEVSQIHADKLVKKGEAVFTLKEKGK